MDLDTLRWLRRTADRHGFLLITDEVMSGFGRTGRWFACDHAGITPDLLTSGKGLTCGYTTLAVTFVADHITRTFGDTPIGSVVLGHTMSGNPLAAATSLAVLRHLRAHNIPDRAAASGTALHHRLEDLRHRHPVITAVRGRGLMLALGIAGHPDQPLSIAHRLIDHARHRGLVLCPGGIDTTTESVMIAPPLNSTPDELDELVTRLDTALTDLAHSLRTDSATRSSHPAPTR
jgi:adenosylmethionine-8-amino-7-oxononanoate aminotransferase